MVKWSLKYTVDTLKKMEENHKELYSDTIRRLGISPDETEKFKEISEKMYLPVDKKLGIFLQQDGFLDKEIIPVKQLKPSDLPLHQHWSWDRILRSCYIKQSDVLQGIWFLNDKFTREEKIRNYEFYEPLTVHESSLSPCVHSILAAEIGRKDKAYEYYLRTARLDLENYNKDTEDGLHITSMAGTWMSIVYGFAGIRIKKGKLHLCPFKPESWDEYSFRLVFRDRILKIAVNDKGVIINLEKGDQIDIVLFGENATIKEGENQYFNLNS